MLKGGGLRDGGIEGNVPEEKASPTLRLPAQCSWACLAALVAAAASLEEKGNSRGVTLSPEGRGTGDGTLPRGLPDTPEAKLSGTVLEGAGL